MLSNELGRLVEEPQRRGCVLWVLVDPDLSSATHSATAARKAAVLSKRKRRKCFSILMGQPPARPP